jgi:hypothetical protein
MLKEENLSFKNNLFLGTENVTNKVIQWQKFLPSDDNTT